jgi:hypothetical protein
LGGYGEMFNNDCKYKLEKCKYQELVSELDCEILRNYDLARNSITDLIVILLKENDTTDRDAGIRLLEGMLSDNKFRLIESMYMTFCDRCKA